MIKKMLKTFLILFFGAIIFVLSFGFLLLSSPDTFITEKNISSLLTFFPQYSIAWDKFVFTSKRNNFLMREIHLDLTDFCFRKKMRESI